MSTSNSARRRSSKLSGMSFDSKAVSTTCSTDLSKDLREVEQLAELSALSDQRLASLNAPLAHRALRAFMDEPLVLAGQLIAGTGA